MILVTPTPKMRTPYLSCGLSTAASLGVGAIKFSITFKTSYQLFPVSARVTPCTTPVSMSFGVFFFQFDSLPITSYPLACFSNPFVSLYDPDMSPYTDIYTPFKVTKILWLLRPGKSWVPLPFPPCTPHQKLPLT